jgi:hypothetical protein
LRTQVEYKFGVNTYNMLKELGANITFKTYNGMAHGVSCWALLFYMFQGYTYR